MTYIYAVTKIGRMLHCILNVSDITGDSDGVEYQKLDFSEFVYIPNMMKCFSTCTYDNTQM